MTSRTVREYRIDASRQNHDYWTGTLTTTAAAAATFLKDTKRVESDGTFRNAFIRINPGTAPEDHRINESYVTDGIMNLAGVGLAAEQASGNTYDIHKRIAADVYDGFTNKAILSAQREGVLASLDDKSLELVGGGNDSSYEYTMPSGFTYIHEIWIEDSAGNYTIFVPLDMVSLLAGSTRKIRFSRSIGITAGRNVRLLGQGVHALPSTGDNAAITLDNDFMLTHIEMSVNQYMASGEGPLAVQAQARARELTGLVELRRTDLSTVHRVRPGSIVVPI